MIYVIVQILKSGLAMTVISAVKSLVHSLYLILNSGAKIIGQSQIIMAANFEMVYLRRNNTLHEKLLDWH